MSLLLLLQWGANSKETIVNHLFNWFNLEQIFRFSANIFVMEILSLVALPNYQNATAF